MTAAGDTFSRRYLTFAGVALLSALVIATVGYVPTVRLSPGAGVRSLLAGCGISWIASCAGAIPLAWAVARSRSNSVVNSFLAATLVRFLTVLALVVPAALSGWFDRVSLVLWVAVSYLLMLGVDTLLAVKMINRRVEKKR